MKNNAKNNSILNLVLTYHWFDEILSGRKKEEYRQPSEYNLRLMCDFKNGLPVDFKPFERVRFRKGYTSIYADFEIKGMFLDLFKNEIPEGFKNGDEVITIELGNMIESNVN